MLDDISLNMPPAGAPPVSIAQDNEAGSSPERLSIQALREKRGMSLCDLAGAAGMLPDHLRAIEAGVVPTIPERQMLAAALGIDPDLIG